MSDKNPDDKEQGNREQNKGEKGSERFRGSLLSAAETVGRLAGRAQSLEIGKHLESAKQAVEHSVEKIKDTEVGKHLGSARQAVGESFEKLTGAEFRAEFEKFTDAVTKVVLGIHRDQAELRAQLKQLEKMVRALQKPDPGM